jgi:hypothetical protein
MNKEKNMKMKTCKLASGFYLPLRRLEKFMVGSSSMFSSDLEKTLANRSKASSFGSSKWATTGFHDSTGNFGCTSRSDRLCSVSEGGLSSAS